MLSGPDGNPQTSSFTQLGCPVLSGGTEHHTETLLIEGRRAILDFLQEVALHDKANNGDDDAAGYKNPEFTVAYADMRAVDTEVDHWRGWVDGEGNAEATAERNHQENPQKDSPFDGTSIPQIVTTDADLQSQSDRPCTTPRSASIGEPALCVEPGDAAANGPNDRGANSSMPAPGIQMDLPLRLRENDDESEKRNGTRD